MRLKMGCGRGVQARAMQERVGRLQVCGEQAQALQEAALVLQAGLDTGRAQVPALSTDCHFHLYT